MASILSKHGVSGDMLGRVWLAKLASFALVHATLGGGQIGSCESHSGGRGSGAGRVGQPNQNPLLS